MVLASRTIDRRPAFVLGVEIVILKLTETTVCRTSNQPASGSTSRHARPSNSLRRMPVEPQGQRAHRVGPRQLTRGTSAPPPPTT